MFLAVTALGGTSARSLSRVSAVQAASSGNVRRNPDGAAGPRRMLLC